MSASEEIGRFVELRLARSAGTFVAKTVGTRTTMSAFREALKSGGHGEWIIETLSASGEVRLRKVEDRRLVDLRFVMAEEAEDRVLLRAA